MSVGRPRRHPRPVPGPCRRWCRCQPGDALSRRDSEIMQQKQKKADEKKEGAK